MKKRRIVTYLLFLAFVAGCAVSRPVRNIESPEHHINNGYAFLHRGMTPEAEDEFKAALEGSPQFGPAYAGLAIIRARQGHYLLAYHLLNQARTYGSGNKELSLVEVAALRVSLEEKKKGWLEDALAAFNRACRLDPDSMQPYYFLGLAYKESYNFQDAERMFQRATEMPGPYYGDALREAGLMRTIRLYPPQTMIGRKVAAEPRVSRAETAAVLVEEFGLESWVKVPKGGEVSFPEGSLDDHPFRPAVELVVKSGVAEPEMFAGGPYRPDDPITRIELAAIIQNIIIRATGMQDIAAMYLNRRSPFSDVPTVSPCFNAVMLSATWGIMTTQVSNQEQFDPLGPESGPGMLKTLYRLKEKIEQLKAGKIDQP